MRKTIVSAVIIGVFAIYCLLHNQSSTAALLPATTSSSNTTSGAPSSSSSTASATASGTAAPGARYKDGSFVGIVADAQWGYVQVRAVIQGGKISDVQWVQYPSDRQRSVEINQIADPQLTSEAIQAQGAQVDVVTGATDSSVAFMQSLSDALSQAQA
jgi:uncharacterized protein with FMN-binding domain